MNLSNIFSSKNIPQHTPTTLESYLDPDFETLMLECIHIVDDDYFSIMKENTVSMYHGQKDNNVEILAEATGSLSERIVGFFKKLIKSIAEFFKKAWTYFMSFFGDFDKFIIKYKTILDKCDPDFDIDMFTYTFTTSVPNKQPAFDLINDFNTGITNIENTEYSELLTERREAQTDEAYGKLRAKVLNLSSEIAADDYIDMLKRSYRNSMEERTSEHINKSVLSKILVEYGSVKKNMVYVKKEYLEIQKMLDKLKNIFESGPIIYYSGDKKVVNNRQLSVSGNTVTQGNKSETKYSAEYIKKLNLFYSFYFEQAKFISALITNGYYEKIAAMKECLASYRSVIRRSIFNKKESEVEVTSND